MADPLLDACLRIATTSGTTQTRFSALSIVRSDTPLPRVHAVHRPSLCFLASGAKEVVQGGEVFRYGAEEFLFTSVDLPVSGEIVEASRKKPYVCLVLEIDPNLVFELAAAMDTLHAGGQAPRALFVGQRNPDITSAFERLVRCLGRREDVAVLAPAFLREITYRLLQGPYGHAVRELGLANSQTRRIARVVELLKRDFAEALRTSELARAAGMSASSFHAHFKRVTGLSPLQCQKQLRLQEARRLLLREEASAADVAFNVGYESTSQFSREYARMFGLPPMRDVRRIMSSSTRT
jgi:AraC-like DNA-binding protein